MEHYVCGLFWFWMSCSMEPKQQVFSSREGKCVPVVQQVVFVPSTTSRENSLHHFPQCFEFGTKQHLLSVAQSVSSCFLS